MRPGDGFLQFGVRLGPDALDFVFRYLGACRRFFDDAARLRDGCLTCGFRLGARPRDSIVAVAFRLRLCRVEPRGEHLVRFFTNPANLVGQALLRLALDAFALHRERLPCGRFSRCPRVGHRRFALSRRPALDAFQFHGALPRRFRLDTRNLAIAFGFCLRDVELARQGLVRFLANPANLLGQALLGLALDAFTLRRECLTGGRVGRCPRFGHRGLALRGRLTLDAIQFDGALLRGFGFDARNLTVALGFRLRGVKPGGQHPVGFFANPANFLGQALLRLALDAFALCGERLARRRVRRRPRLGYRRFALGCRLSFDAFQLAGALPRGLGLDARYLAIALDLRLRRVELRRQDAVRFLANAANFVGQALLRLALDAFTLRRERLARRRFCSRPRFGHRRFALGHRLALDALELGGALLRGFGFHPGNLAGTTLGRFGLDASHLERLLPGRLRLQAVELVL